MRQIGNYTVEDIPIGSGGMGQVWKGFSVDGTREVAIKEILPQFVIDPEYRMRIESEINFMKMLDNDRVVKIYDSFELGQSLYIVMEYIDGLNVEQYVNTNGRLKWQEAVRLMIQVLDTLQYVHEQGIIHRDIKPGNIMIKKNGDICLVDFGVAKAVSKGGGGKKGTLFGTVIGTDGYMSPEQANGYDIDHRSDIYALGCLLFYMITGTHAFDSTKSELELHSDIRSGKFPRLSDIIKGVPSSLQKVIGHAVDKNMMRRYQSCREFACELASLQTVRTDILIPGGAGAPKVSIGRENCDIIIGQKNNRVSRYHAEVELKENTGGKYYVFTDMSSNGSFIDGRKLTKGMTHLIRPDDDPIILLAGEADSRLDFNEVKMAIDALPVNQGGSSESHGTSSGSHSDSVSEAFGPSAGHDTDSFIGAIKSCFSKYAQFSGRASRSEYWWFYLFVFFIMILVTLAYIFSHFEPVFGIIYSVVGILLIIPTLAVGVRRLHDIGKSGNWMWTLILPGANLVLSIYLLVWFIRPGDPEPNRFGPPPGARAEAGN